MMHHSLQGVIMSRLTRLKGWSEAFEAFREEILFCRGQVAR